MAASNLQCPVIKIKSLNTVFISDIHFGVHRATEEWQENINDYFENWFIPYIKKNLKTYPDLVLICLGDVYEDRQSIDINVNNLSIDIFEKLSEILPCYIINGNHDLAKKTNKGNSSLRSLTNIDNLTVIKEPTMLQFYAPDNGRKIVSSMIAIPYLGDCNEENKELVKYSGKAEYALMHTDISKMKFDNGMTIVGAVDADKFSGKIISGHIHKRQETDKVIYVGNPYMTKRTDIGNDKGIYLLNIDTGNMTFSKNDYSPIFQRIDVTKFMNFTDKERREAIQNTYTDIIVRDTDEDQYKSAEIYLKMNGLGAKKIQTQPVKTKKTNEETGEIVDIQEKSLDVLVIESIDAMEDTSDEDKKILKSMANEYYTNALTQIKD